jgi:hypothetical protein
MAIKIIARIIRRIANGIVHPPKDFETTEVANAKIPKNKRSTALRT